MLESDIMLCNARQAGKSFHYNQIVGKFYQAILRNQPTIKQAAIALQRLELSLEKTKISVFGFVEPWEL